MDTWPATLPQYPLIAGYARTQQPQTVRTEMDAGPAYVRRRFTAASTYFSESTIVDAAQRATFWEFFNTTLAGGALPFSWKDPVTAAAGIFRFMGEPQEVAYTDDIFEIKLSLEMLP
jgi:hypothetical protein